MDFIRVSEKEFDGLARLQVGYKQEIGEAAPSGADLTALLRAIREEDILFFACLDEGAMVGCCSVCPTFSTFDYGRGGVFEDFYILPEYRHRGIARALVRFAFERSGVSSLTVGCADCDVEMYKALGFHAALGNMFAYGE